MKKCGMRSHTAFYLLATNALLGNDGQQCVTQLGQRYTQQLQFFQGKLTGKIIGNGRNSGCQFAGIHSITVHKQYMLSCELLFQQLVQLICLVLVDKINEQPDQRINSYKNAGKHQNCRQLLR